MSVQDPTFIPNQIDEVKGLANPVPGAQAAQTARPAPGQRKLTPKEREQRQLALGPIVPSKEDEMCKCTAVLHYAVFFDGTDNNRDQEMAKEGGERALSNVAKLFDAHKDGESVKAKYIPGVGTPYPAIGDAGGASGMAIGEGAGPRIKKALDLLDEEIAKIPKEQKLLLINVTVFGFSRGAAQARAFMRDLAALCNEEDGAYVYKKAPLRIAFAGLYDTVCSAYGNFASAAISLNGGHNNWAEDMKLPPMVEQTVHMNAAHELRRRFPLDSTRVDAVYPDNTVEIWYPGVHSDVGGGYAPGYQGRENTISRFSLNHMFDVAFEAGVLFERIANLPGRVKDEFTKDNPELRAAFNAYIEAVPMKTGALENVQAAHMGLFHRWLKKRVSGEADTPSIQRLKAAREAAKAKEKEAYDQRVALMQKNGGPNPRGPSFSAEDRQKYDDALAAEKKAQAAASEAKSALSDLGQESAKYRSDVEEILWREKNGLNLTLRERTIKEAWDNSAELPADVEKFFDSFAHDSVAHFNYDTSRLSDWRTIYFADTKYKPS
jgi:Uncharacterized alpha/beta hydrolase domain (DUF2235)